MRERRGVRQIAFACFRLRCGQSLSCITFERRSDEEEYLGKRMHLFGAGTGTVESQLV